MKSLVFSAAVFGMSRNDHKRAAKETTQSFNESDLIQLFNVGDFYKKEITTAIQWTQVRWNRFYTVIYKINCRTLNYTNKVGYVPNYRNIL